MDETDLSLSCCERLVCRIPDYFLRDLRRTDECKWGFEFLLIILVHLFNRHVLPNLQEPLPVNHPVLAALRDVSQPPGLPVCDSGCSQCGFQWPQQSHPLQIFDLRQVLKSLELPAVRVRRLPESEPPPSPVSPDSIGVPEYESIVSEWAWSYLHRLESSEGVIRISRVKYLPLINEVVLHYTPALKVRTFLTDVVYGTQVTNLTCKLAIMESTALNFHLLATTKSSVALTLEAATEKTKDECANVPSKSVTPRSSPIRSMPVYKLKVNCEFKFVTNPAANNFIDVALVRDVMANGGYDLVLRWVGS